MKGKTSGRDPFAGYTPVKVSVPVVDVPSRPAERPRPGKKYKFGKNGESGDLSRTVKLIVVLLVSAVLVLVIAMFSFGVIYDKPVQQAVPELADYADDITPLSDAGRTVRQRVLDVVSGIGSSHGGKAEGKPPAASVDPTTNFIVSVAKGVKGVSKHKEKVCEASKVADQPDEAMSEADPAESCNESGISEPKSAVYGAKASTRREVDPRLKEFYNGGRKGRSMGDWRRKTK